MGESGKTGCLVAILIFLFAGAIMNAAQQCGTKNDSKPTSKLVAQSFKEDPHVEQPVATPPRQYTSAERLAEAKIALNNKTKNTPHGDLPEAEHHLNNIKPEDKEYREAKKILVEIEKKKAAIKKANERELEKFAANVRKLYAKELEKQYLSNGMDIDVELSGPQSTTIRLKYILMSRPLVYKLTAESDFLQVLKKQGFKKVILSDGYNSTWTYDLSK